VRAREVTGRCQRRRKTCSFFCSLLFELLHLSPRPVGLWKAHCIQKKCAPEKMDERMKVGEVRMCVLKPFVGLRERAIVVGAFWAPQ